MKLILESKQYYGSHVEEIKEEFECTVDDNDDIIKIIFENGYIQIEEDKIIHERGENKLVIEKDSTYEVDYDTANRMIVLDLKGLEVNRTSNKTGLIASAKYEIKMVGVEPYINEINIFLL